MKTKRVWQLVLCIVGSPALAFFLFYTYRWILMGRWVEGGGDRAVVAFLMALVLFGAAAIFEIE